MSKASKEALDDLHGELARQLAAKIKSGEATAADMAVARQFLKDNGIDAAPTDSPALDDLQKANLPFADPAAIAADDEVLH